MSHFSPSKLKVIKPVQNIINYSSSFFFFFTDPHGGVFIAFKKDLIATREPELETGCEIISHVVQFFFCPLFILLNTTYSIYYAYNTNNADTKQYLQY